MDDPYILGGLLIGILIGGPLLGWLAGLGNPIGWTGVLPWRVPACACPPGYVGLMHHQDCPVAHPPRR